MSDRVLRLADGRTLGFRIWGDADGRRLFTELWGVDLSAIRASARVWIGTADTAVPIVAARLLARSISECAMTELPGEGRLWVAAQSDEVLAWVSGMLEGGAPNALH
jgi:hypothetical protein